MKTLESYLRDHKLLKHAIRVATVELGHTEKSVLEILRAYRMKPCTSAKFLGRVNYRTKTFYISAHEFQEGEQVEVILHELAHVYAGEFMHERGHGRAWKDMCELLGSEGTRTSGDAKWLDAALKFKHTRAPNHSWRRKGR